MDSNDRFIHEAYMSMAERTIKRLWVLCIVIFFALVGTNSIWIYHEAQYTDEQTTTIDASQDGSGFNLISGGDLSYRTESANYHN